MSTVATALVPHARLRAAKSNDGTIYMVNGIDRPIAWDGIGAAVRNYGIDSPTATPTLTLPAGGVLTGDYYYYVTFYNSVTGEYSGPSPLSAVIAATADTIRVTKVSTTTDGQVDRWQIWRNTAGQTTTFYLVGDTGIANATLDDNMSDASASGQDILEDRTTPDAKKPYIVNYNGRIFLYGSREETTGTATATNAAGTLGGVGTYFRQSHVGQRIRFGTESTYYTIATVTNTTTATFTPNYAGATGSKTFRIYPIRRSDLAWSSALSAEGFAIEDSVGVHPFDGDIPSGMHVVGTVLVLFKRSKSYRFTFDGDPNPILGNGQISRGLSNRGLINNECCTVVGDTAYCLDSLGIYLYDGATQEVEIDQAIRRYFHPDEAIPTSERVSRAYSSTWHSVFEPKSNCVWWFVTTGTETQPKTAFVFDRDRQRWTTHKFVAAITASAIEVNSNGESTAWVGDENGCLWSLSGIRQSEGVYSGTTSGTATAGGASTLTDSGASFYTTGTALKGAYVTIVSGTGSGQQKVISSNTGTQLTIDGTWTTNPDTTSVYAIGLIDSRWKYNWMRIAGEARGLINKVVLFAEPASDDRYFRMRMFKDGSSSPYLEWMPQAYGLDGYRYVRSTDGWVDFYVKNMNGRIELVVQDVFENSVAFEFQQYASNLPVQFIGFNLLGEVVAPQQKQRNP